MDFYSIESLGMLAVGAILAASLLGAGHWWPPPAEPKEKPLPDTIKNLLIRYVYGTLALLAGGAIWLIWLGLGWIVLGLLIIDAAGGLAVWMAYKYDEHRLIMLQHRIVERSRARRERE